MAAELNVTFVVAWIEEEPEGLPCELCGDVAYLRQWRPILLVNGKEWGHAKFITCDACKD